MIKTVARWITSHQVAAFFIITFLITWGLGFSYRAVTEGKYLALPLMFLATCGPALAGILIASLAGIERPPAGKRMAWLAFFLSWVVVVLAFIANHWIVNRGSVTTPLVILVAISALPVALIVNLVYTHFPVVRRFQLSPLRPGGSPQWILIAFLIFPVLTVISMLICRLRDPQFPLFINLPATGFGLAGWIAAKFLSQFFYFNGTGEEAGWRGFALPRLQSRVSPLVAGLILALVWVPWHLFLWTAEGRPVMTFSFWVSSYLLHIPSCIILCWCYNRSRGSLLAAGVAHVSANTFTALFQPLDQKNHGNHPLCLCGGRRPVRQDVETPSRRTSGSTEDHYLT